MTKKAIVKEICDRLTELGVTKDGCFGLNVNLPNGNRLNWVGYRQVLIGIKDPHMANVFWVKRFPLYSKEINLDLLNLIKNELG